ncbi:scarecrow-like protein 23 [Vigna radiata var. radiata]|uniref:Scarecrow-like protein 23 n=1 Tax=Vigna radiata var. radiata TaxID=3916 RepID=A0A3Q0ES25_VIGRR|nr:scarecrow-like protein 23 [Vigna radiata var. radiata]
MLQSLVPRSPHTSNLNDMKTKLPVNTVDSLADQPSFKRTNFSVDTAIEEDQAFDPHPHAGDIMQGLQWPGLFHILASCSKKIRSMRIIGFESSSELLDFTGRRLADFASSFGLPFEFHPVEGKIGSVIELSQLDVRASEAIVVHWMHHCLYDITGSDLADLA